MTTAIRALESALGTGALPTSVPATPAARRARRGIYAARSLPAGTVLDATDVKVVRPALGAVPAALPQLIGKRLARHVAIDEPLGIDDGGEVR